MVKVFRKEIGLNINLFSSEVYYEYKLILQLVIRRSVYSFNEI